jgi:hypothetical protein
MYVTKPIEFRCTILDQVRVYDLARPYYDIRFDSGHGVLYTSYIMDVLEYPRPSKQTSTYWKRILATTDR